MNRKQVINNSRPYRPKLRTRSEVGVRYSKMFIVAEVTESKYRILVAGKFGEDFNLADWRIDSKPPN